MQVVNLNFDSIISEACITMHAWEYQKLHGENEKTAKERIEGLGADVVRQNVLGPIERGYDMTSTPEYLEYILDLLDGVPDVSSRKMMGEYVLYASGKVFGGIYDDRFLVKKTPTSEAALAATEVPYEGGSEMMLVDIEDRDAIAELVAGMLPKLPEPKKRRK